MSTHSLRAQASVWAVVLAVAGLPSMTGCTQGKFPVAKAKGKVVCNGQPVTAGSVTFSPVGESGSLEAGKPATATVGPDGTFVLSTNGQFDGAVVGKHSVQYVGSEGDEEEAADTGDAPAANAAGAGRQPQGAQCVQQGEIILEVKADGENDFTIELVPAGNQVVPARED